MSKEEWKENIKKFLKLYFKSDTVKSSFITGLSIIIAGLLGASMTLLGIYLQFYFSEIKEEKEIKEESYAEILSLKQSLIMSIYRVLEGRLDDEYWRYRYMNLTKDPYDLQMQRSIIVQTEEDAENYGNKLEKTFITVAKIKSNYKLTDNLNEAINEILNIDSTYFKIPEIENTPDMADLDSWILEKRSNLLSSTTEEMKSKFNPLIEELEKQLKIK